MSKWDDLKSFVQDKVSEESKIVGGWDWAVRYQTYREIQKMMDKVDNEEYTKSLTEAGY